MSGRTPSYRKAYVYFSSPISKELIVHIKNDKSVLPRIGALREINLEYLVIDSQGYITDQTSSLEDLFAVDGGSSRKLDICLNTMANRIATVFASLKEYLCPLHKLLYLPIVGLLSRGSSMDKHKLIHDLVPCFYLNNSLECSD